MCVGEGMCRWQVKRHPGWLGDAYIEYKSSPTERVSTYVEENNSQVSCPLEGISNHVKGKATKNS
jgi:hypothetical protein